jgi:hypothetical protein
MPWGAGGFERDIPLEEEPRMVSYLRSIGAGLKEGALIRFARYTCGLSHFADTHGPPNAKAVGEACGLPAGAVNNLLNENRDPWGAAKVRHKLGVSALRGKVDGILISHFFSSFDPGYTIITAHAFTGNFRMLITARSSKRPESGPEAEEDLQRAYRSLIEEVYYLLSNLSCDEPVPVLAESRFVGQAAIASLVASELDYLVELAAAWSDGGLVPFERVPRANRMPQAGTSLRGLFPLLPKGPSAEVSSCAVVLESWSRNLGNWAVALGQPGPEQRFFLGRAAAPDHLASGSGMLVEERAKRWAAEDLEAGIWQGYGLENYHAPNVPAFERHSTALTLRDAYRIDQS